MKLPYLFCMSMVLFTALCMEQDAGTSLLQVPNDILLIIIKKAMPSLTATPIEILDQWLHPLQPTILRQDLDLYCSLSLACKKFHFLVQQKDIKDVLEEKVKIATERGDPVNLFSLTLGLRNIMTQEELALERKEGYRKAYREHRNYKEGEHTSMEKNQL